MSEENILKKNLEQIAKYDEDLAIKIANVPSYSHNFELKETKCDDINLYMDGIALHDEVDAIYEVEQIVAKTNHKEDKNTIHVLFGLGFGYLLKAFVEGSEGKIIIYEPEVELLRAVLEIVDFSDILSRENVFLVNEEEKFETAMGKLFFVRGEMTLSFLNSYVKIYPQKVSDLAKKLSMLRSIYSNAYTEIQKQSFYWTSYTLDNLHRVYKNEEMEAIEGAFKNKPAIIVSAGPSLNDNLEYLKKYRDKIVIFCVGTALKTLLKNGIKPDFVNIIESGFCSAQVSFVDLDGINFILYPSTYPDVYNHITQRVFNYYPDNLITSDWLKNLVGVDYTKYKNRGTVAITSMMSAFLCGCNPIILTGQDLAYKDGKCYASGSPYNLSYKEVSPGKFELFIDDFEKYAETRKNKANYDPEKFEKEVKQTLEDNSKKLCFVKGQDGRNLVTSPAYAMFVEHFENLALELQDKVKLYNTSTGGAQINGFENIPMEEVLKQNAKEPVDVEGIILKSLKTYNKHLDPKPFLEEIRSLKKIVKETGDLYKIGIPEFKKFKNEYNRVKAMTNSIIILLDRVSGIYKKIVFEKIIPNKVMFGLLIKEYFVVNEYLKEMDGDYSYESVQKLIEALSVFFKDRDYLMDQMFDILTKQEELFNESINTESK